MHCTITPFAVARIIKNTLGSLNACKGWVVIACLFYMAWSYAAAITTPAAITPYGQAEYAQLSAMPYANPQAPKGGEMVQYGGENFDSLNALINKGMPAQGTALLFDSLTSGSPDEPFARYPLLAERVTRDLQDPSWIIYHLNPKATFSDGVSVTAADVVFTFNLIKAKGHPGLKIYYDAVQRVIALNPHTVKFEFKTRDNFEIGLTVGEQAILAQHDWQNRAAQDAFDRVSLRPPIGSGPYRVGAVQAGKSITYIRRPDYWGSSLPVNKGRFNMDVMKYVCYLDEEIAFQGFKVGQYNFREENKAKRWVKDYDHLPAIEQQKMVKVLLPHQKPMTMQALVLNLRNPMFQDIRFRQALHLAFDFEWMNKALFNGLYQRVNSFFANTELAAVGDASPEERRILQPLLPTLSADVATRVMRAPQPIVSDASGFNRANLLKARQLLLQAGYRFKEGKLLSPQGVPVQFEVLIRQKSLERVVLPWVRQLARLGITATIRTVDDSQYIERARAFKYDVIIDQFPQSVSPGAEQIGYWGSSSANESGSNNSAGIAHPAIDAVLKQLIATHDRKKLIVYTRVLDRLLFGHHYMIPMYGLAADRVVYWNVFDRPARKPKYTIGEDYWWYNPTKAKQVKVFLRQGER